MSDDPHELLPGDPRFERALAQGQFEFAKTRYVRTLTADVAAAIVGAAAGERSRLNEEIKRLQEAARVLYEAALDAAREYAEVLPHRVGPDWLQPPSALEKLGETHGSVQLYKRAARAAKVYAEAHEQLVQEQLKLTALERELRLQIAREEAVVQRALRTARGLGIALRRDPLLNVAYQHLRAVSRGADADAHAIPDAVPDAFSEVSASAPAEPG